MSRLKYLLAVLLILFVIFAFAGCGNKDDADKSYDMNYLENHGFGASDSPDVINPVHYYGFMEECSKNGQYLQVTSFAVTSSLHPDRKTANGSGYYVVLRVNTNLTENAFADRRNEVKLKVPNELSLQFVSLDPDKGELVYEITQDNSVDYERLLKLYVSDVRPLNGETVLKISLHVFDRDITEDIYTVKKIIWLKLDYA